MKAAGVASRKGLRRVSAAVWRPRAGRRRATALAGVVVLQALCATFFVGDVIGDLGGAARTLAFDPHDLFEAAVAAALVLGVVFGAIETRRAIEDQRRAEAALSVASGAFAEVLDAFFSRWALTPAERDVALMALKGLSNEDIAAARGAAVGTVRAQTARVYAKAGVSGRAQLMSVFVEELLAERLVKAAPEPEAAGAR